MTAPLVQKLSLVVDATTGQTESRMDALATASREAGVAATQSAGQVAAAAERIAAAQLRRDDAADKVRLAEQRLVETQEKGTASASQLLAAEQRLESARRGLAVATRGVEAAQLDQTRVQGQAAEATARAATEQERARLGAGKMQDQLGSLKGAAAGLAAFQLGDWARDQVGAYLAGARGANALSVAMNATIEQGGQLTQLFASMGLEADDLLEIQAQFASTGKDGLTAMGTELQHNRDGTVNWATSLTDALGQLQKIPDATERNRLGFAMFGEEGYKQLSRLLTSGMSVEDAMAAIGTPFTAEDVATAQQYDRSMQQLSLASGDLGRTLAREVVPLLGTVVGGLGNLAGVVTAIPLPMTLATAAAVAMGRTGFDPLARAGDFARDRLESVRTAMANATSGVEEGAGRMQRATALARGGVGGLVNMLGGPLGVAAIGAGIAYTLVSQGAEDLETHAREAAAEVERLGGTSNDAAVNTRQLARALQEQAGSWETIVASMKGAQAQRDDMGGLQGFLAEASGAFGFTQVGVTQAFADEEAAARGFQLSVEEARKELGELGAQQMVTAETSRTLTDLIAEGTLSGDAFATAVAEAAAAQADQTRTSDTATAAIAAYHATTDLAVQSVLGLIDAQLQQADAGYAFLSAMDDAKSATDDSKTSVDEVAQAHTRLQSAALSAAKAAGDAAVAQATAAGQVITPLEEAKIRADSMITDLTTRLNTPGISKGAQADLQGLIDKLTAARDKGDVTALVTLTGADQAGAELDATTEDRDAHITVETRGGPAVVEYLDRLTADRLSLIRLESRGGPAVDDYVDGLARERLAIIRVETRNGPAVDTYLDELAGAKRTAVIDVQRRDGGAAPGGGSGAAGMAGLLGAAPISIGQLIVQPQVDSGGRLSAAGAQVTGRQVVSAIRDYTRQNGPGWLQGISR